MKAWSGSEDGSMKSDDRNSSGSYASAALHSIFSMLTYNIGLGSNSTNSNRSDADDENMI